ncbi:hypothetical protein GCM10010103_68640 [Streptomyces paradoxus]
MASRVPASTTDAVGTDGPFTVSACSGPVIADSLLIGPASLSPACPGYLPSPYAPTTEDSTSPGDTASCEHLDHRVPTR